MSPYDTCMVSKGGRISGSAAKTMTPPTTRRARRGILNASTPGRERSCASEDSRRPEEEDDRGDQVEDGQLDLREVRDTECPDHAHDDCAGERALQRAEPAD